MTVDEILRALTPFALARGFDESAACSFFSARCGEKLDRPLGDALAAGLLTNEHWRSVTGSDAPHDFSVAFGALWGALNDAGLAREAIGEPKTWTFELVRQWAHAAEWLLMSQDEDLILMVREELFPWLLQVAPEPACPKRDYIFGVIAHWARDEAFAALGSDRFGGVLARIGALEPLVRQAGNGHVADYFRRSESYADEARVDHDGALQRAVDLNRCRRPTPEEVQVVRDGEHWLVTLPAQRKLIRIAAHGGQIAGGSSVVGSDSCNS
ncbi:MAG: hypothetical protein QM756_15450 [Polyangiaceae bacterium]